MLNSGLAQDSRVGDFAEAPAGKSDGGQAAIGKNVSIAERVGSVAGGIALAAAGLRKGGIPGLALGLLGGSLVYRGASGHCGVYSALGVSTARRKHNGGASLDGSRSIKVEKSITVNRPASELFAFWRNFENLPRVMNHLKEVRVISPKQSHWITKAPAGATVEWDAEIINERQDELIAWKSLEGADVDNAGSVRFEPTPRGTIVKVTLMYLPPAGQLGAAIARFFHEEPSQQVEADLRRFKLIMENSWHGIPG